MTYVALSETWLEGGWEGFSPPRIVRFRKRFGKKGKDKLIVLGIGYHWLAHKILSLGSQRKVLC